MYRIAFCFSLFLSFCSAAIAAPIDCTCEKSIRIQSFPTWKLSCASGYTEREVGLEADGCWVRYGKLQEQFGGKTNGYCECTKPGPNSDVILQAFRANSPYLYRFSISPSEAQFEACNAFVEKLKTKGLCN